GGPGRRATRTTPATTGADRRRRSSSTNPPRPPPGGPGPVRPCREDPTPMPPERRAAARIGAVTEQPSTWVARDAAVVWHGFTQMSAYAESGPVMVESGEGRELIDVGGQRYLDAISSLWVTTLGHGVPELDQALRDQLDR